MDEHDEQPVETIDTAAKAEKKTDYDEAPNKAWYEEYRRRSEALAEHGADAPGVGG